jgi:hypothetical protein
LALTLSAIGVLFVSIWAAGFLPFIVDLPIMLRVFFPYVGFPLTLVLVIVLLMNITACGRNGLLCLKRFIKRWGLRILMLCLDLLYIPILTGVIPLLAPKQSQCKVGEYLAYDRVPRSNDPFFDFINHTATCVPCLAGPLEYISTCKDACSGRQELRLMEHRNLLFIDDVLKPVGPLIIYCLSVGMLGIPGMFYHITLRNRRFVRNIYVFGKSLQDKWDAIVERLETTGIFLFAMYKYP